MSHIRYNDQHPLPCLHFTNLSCHKCCLDPHHLSPSLTPFLPFFPLCLCLSGCLFSQQITNHQSLLSQDQSSMNINVKISCYMLAAIMLVNAFDDNLTFDYFSLTLKSAQNHSETVPVHHVDKFPVQVAPRSLLSSYLFMSFVLFR